MKCSSKQTTAEKKASKRISHSIQQYKSQEMTIYTCDNIISKTATKTQVTIAEKPFKTIIPKGYKPLLNLLETEEAITKLKQFFEKELASKLNLTRVSAPLFVKPESGLNDNLNGVETAVSFEMREIVETGHGSNGDDLQKIEIVHSLAKWKRSALKRYGFKSDQGLYTHMIAIRKDEQLSNFHSMYVDQWDWEKVIDKEQRNLDTLKRTVEAIYEAFKNTEDYMAREYPKLFEQSDKWLPERISFVTSQELEDRWPELSAKDREHAICRELGAVFLIGIGGTLKSGQKHDGRAPDYDDWNLNGDILFWYPPLNRSIELSSMGIRVDKDSLLRQLKICQCEHRMELEFHKILLEERWPYSIGGGLGMSRVCMYFLRKAHIGEVHHNIWDRETLKACRLAGIELL